MKNRKNRIHLHTQQNKKGFTLAEFLIAAGILAILAAFGFVAVTSYQRKLKLTEMDDTAREIFVAAQNHLTAAKASGEWDELFPGKISENYFGEGMDSPSDYPGGIDKFPEDGIERESGSGDTAVYKHYYRTISFKDADRENQLKGTVGEVILPYGAIDESLLGSGGSYVIEYDAATAAIYGVFYCDSSDITNEISSFDAKNGRTDKEARLEYKNNAKKRTIIGYYGGAMADKLSTDKITAPVVKVNNAETLSLSIEDSNSSKTRAAVEITGEESGAKETWPLMLDKNGTAKANITSASDLAKYIHAAWTFTSESGKRIYNLTFDDITKENGHFADLFPDFIPGENLIIKVSCTGIDVLAPTQYASAYTNSLFESRHNRVDSSSGKTVMAEDQTNKNKSEVTIAYIRHLQNLSPAVSKLPTGIKSTTPDTDKKFYVASALQTKDLDWNSDEAQKVYDNANIWISANGTNKTAVDQGCFYGIENYGLEKYAGEKKNGDANKEICNLTIQAPSNYNGLFTQIGGTSGGTGATSQKLEVSNLTLKGFTVAAEKDAGVLSGYVGKDATLNADNVLIIDPTVNSQEGNTGGLAGTLSNGKITGCGVYFVSDEVKSTDAKSDGKKTSAQKYEEGAYNITSLNSEFGKGKYHIYSAGSGSAGGLIGSIPEAAAAENAEEKEIITENCFASVPVIAQNGSAGGLLGLVQREKVSVRNSYAAGFTQEKNVENIYSIVMTGGSDGKSAVGGLIGMSQNGLTVKNCYTTASVYGHYAGGFIGRDDSQNPHSSYLNCYTVSKVETEKIEDAGKDTTKAGAFAAVLEKADLKKCYYTREINASLSGVKGKEDVAIGISGLFYEELKAAAFEETKEGEKTTTPLPASEEVHHATYPYDEIRYTDGAVSDEELYPFATVNDTAKKATDGAFAGSHIGDWIENNNQKIGLVYYEKIWNEDTGKANDKTYYNGYAYNSNMPKDTQKDALSSGSTDVALVTGPNQYVTEDGYLLLIPKGWKLDKIKLSIEEEQVTADKLFKSEAAEGILTEEDAETYDAYYLDLTKVDKNFTDGKYNHVVIKGGVRADFTMTPDFADSVICGEDKEQKNFKIRSARHLAQLQGTNAYTGYTAPTDYVFEQELDIDFSDTRAEMGYDESIITTFKESIFSFGATYISNTYTGDDANIYSYKIRGLSETLFASNTGKIRGISLTNLKITGNSDEFSVAGFVQTNIGRIENCHIYSDNISNSPTYADVFLSRYTKKHKFGYIAGFAVTNIGMISNCSFTGSISLKGNFNDAAGFINVNLGTIEECYANSVITEESNQSNVHLAGFITSNSNEINKSYAAGQIESKTKNRIAAGFARENAGKINECYSAQWLIKCDGIYRFSYDRGGGTSKKCAYLSDMAITGQEMKEDSGGEGIEHEDLSIYFGVDATESITKKYGQYNKDKMKTYPFAIWPSGDNEVTMQHYGDWPSNESIEELAYYEVYKAKNGEYSLGLYNATLDINSLIEELPDGTHIIQDGYVLLTTTKGNYNIEGMPCHSIEDIRAGNKTISVSGRDMDKAVWSSESGVLDADTRLNTGGHSYLLKFFDLSTVDALSGNSYYSKIKVEGGNTDRYFYYNPHYAKSLVQNCGVDNTSTCNLEIPSSNIIRTERQYSMMTQDLQNPDSSNCFRVYAKASYLQKNDLAFGTSCRYVSSYFGSSTKSREGADIVPALKPVVAAANKTNTTNPQDTVGFRGIYDGKNHKISDLPIAGESGKSAGIFGNTQSAVIKNLVLDNITIDGSQSDYVGVLVGSAAHLSSGGNSQIYTTIQNVQITDSKVTGEKYVGGLVGAGYSCSVNPDGKNSVILTDITIGGDSCVGGVFGYISDYSTSLTNGLSIMNVTGTGLKITESSTHTTDSLSYGIGGFAGRIYTAYGRANTFISFKNVHLDNCDLQIDKSDNSNDRIAGGLWVGTLNNKKSYTESISASFAYTDCNIKNSTLSTLAVGTSNKVAFGGLYGAVNNNNKTQEVFLAGDIIGEKNRVELNNSGAVGVNVGGLVGSIAKTKLIMDDIDRYNLPELSGFSKSNTSNLGGYIGYLDDVVFNNAKAYNLGELSMSKGISAVNLGGFIGSVNNSDLSGIHASGLTDKNDQTYESTNAGGIMGKAEKSAFTNIHFIGNTNKTKINADNIRAENFGVFAGNVLSGCELSDIKAENLDIVASAKNIGGLIGKSTSYTYDEVVASKISVTGSNLNRAGINDERNLGGVIGYSESGRPKNKDASKVDAKTVTIDMGVNSDVNNIGGIIGKSGNNDEMSLSADDLTVKGAAINKGGVVGKLAGGKILKASADKIKIKDKGNNIGGVLGFSSSANSKVSNVIASGIDITASVLTDEMNVGGAIGKFMEGTGEGIQIKYLDDQMTLTVNAQNAKTSNVGGTIGSAEGGTQLTDISTNEKVNIISPGFNNVGGVIGSVSESASLKEINRTSELWVIASSENLNSEVMNAGGIFGSITGGTVNGAKATAEISISQQKIANFGGGVGVVSGGTLSNMVIGNQEQSGMTIQELHSHSSENVGGVVGNAKGGTITACSVQNVKVAGDDNTNIGGFAGVADGSVSDSMADNVIVSSTSAICVGGFVGLSKGTIANCDVRLSSIADDVTANETGNYKVASSMQQSNVGGFAGLVEKGTIQESFAAIPVEGTANNAGGFAGCIQNSSTIKNSYASGDVKENNSIMNDSYAGGFVGVIQNNSNIFDCYSTGDILQGQIVGGFAGKLDKGAFANLNNCYSLGSVNQMAKTHGGFVGEYAGEIKRTPTFDLEKVKLFYDLLNFDLQEAMKKENNERGIYADCVKRLAKRSGVNADNITTLYKYIVENATKEFDSTSALLDLNNYSPDLVDVPVAAVINKLIQTEQFTSLSSISDWRLECEGDKINLIITSYDLESLYKKDIREVSCCKYTPNGDSFDMEFKKATLSWSTRYTTTDKKGYPVMSAIVDNALSEEKFNGCVYLSDESCKYNIAEEWSDDSLIKEGILQTKTFDEMTVNNKDYVQELNANQDGSEGERFINQSIADNTHRYDKTLPAAYPYPTLMGVIGCETKDISHWGDWPDKPEISGVPDFDFGLVYYEKIEGDDTVYYHGWGGKFSNNPNDETNYTELKTPGDELIYGLVSGSGKYVAEEGYLVLIPEELQAEKLSVKFGYSWMNNTDNKMFVKTDKVLSSLKGYNVYEITYKETQDYFDNSRKSVEIKQDSNSSNSCAFTMTPYFGDSVQYGKQNGNNNKYYVRAVNHLLSLNTKTNMTLQTQEKHEFIQNLDIRFDENLSKQPQILISEMQVNYKSQYADDEKTQTYKIIGMRSRMFEHISNTSHINGVTLVDAKISNTIAGFVNINQGTIDSCAIISNSSYDTVTIDGGTQNVGGFVNHNLGEIKNSYVVGKITGENVSGFVVNNGGSISNCYSNSIISAKSNASGFCSTSQYENSNYGEIRDSFCTGYFEGGKTVYGFVGYNGKSIQNCYSAPFYLKGEKIYLFGYNGWSSMSEECHWLKEAVYQGQIQTEREIGTAKTYNSLQLEGTSSITHKYNSNYKNIDTKNGVYPFRLESTADAYIPMQYWGDWPKKPETIIKPDGIGVVYYEKLENQEDIYYHGYDNAGNEIASHASGANENGLAFGSGKRVEECGYLILIGNKNQNINAIKTEINNKRVEENNLYEKADDLISLTGIGIFKIEERAYENSYFNLDKTNYVYVKKGNDELSFTMTPYFADTVQPGDQTANKNQTFAIRDSEHLQNLQKLNGFAKNENYNYTFIQQLDIDGAKLLDSIKSFNETYKVTSADKNAGYEICNLKTTLFDEVEKEALLDGITLTGCNIVSSEDEAAGLALENKGTIQNCALIPETSEEMRYVSNKIVSEKEEAAGFVNENEGVIRNCHVTAIVTGKDDAAGFVLENEGTIESCYSNCIVESLEKDAAGFCGETKGGIISNSHSLLQVSAQKGTAYGFIGINKESGKIENCYTALQEFKGKNTDTFGGNIAPDSKNYYLSTVTVTTGSGGNQTESGTGKTYKELSAMASTAPATADTTVKYGQYNTNPADTIYPFALPSAPNTGNAWFIMKHHGDWPESAAKTRMFNAQQDADTQEPNRDSVQPEDTNTSQPNPIAGIAYREANDSGYEGWYAITADGADDEVTTNDQTPYDTLRTDKNIALADDAVSYGILTEAGTKPRVSGVQAEEEITSQVTIDNVLYDYYKIIPAEESHQDITLIVNTGGKEFAFTYNPDFAAAVSYEMSLGTAAEEGGRPYQIRTEAQLRNINENAKFYLNAAYRQTLDIMLGDENFAPIGGVASWADGDFDEKAQDSAVSFAGSYDAGLVKDGRRSTDSSQEEEQEGNSDEVRLPEGYSITGLNQTVILSERDSSKQMYTGLFAAVSGTIRNVNLSGDINLTQTAEDSLMIVYAGSIAGFLTETGDMAGCNSDVAFHMGAGCTEINVGGLAGYSAGNIGDSYYNGAIDGTVKLAGVKGRTAVVGGALGTNTGSVTRSAACAVISLKVENRNKDTDSYLGGFAGWTYGKDSFITDSWSKSFLEGDGSVAGGFAGLISGDRKKYTTLTDNYAVVSILNPEKVKSAGLFAGYAQTDQIWRCHAVSLDGDVTASQVFANGMAADWESRGCYLMPGTDSSLLAVLNGGGMYELVNGMYPTLHDNPEREYDMIKVTSAGGNLQRKEPENQTHETSGEAENSAQSTVPEKEGNSIPDTGSEEENKGSAANPEEGNEGSVSDPEEGNKDGADTDSSESTTAKDPDADSNGKGTNADGGEADAADSGQEKSTSGGVTESGSSSIK